MILGIDPGKTGALAVLGDELKVFDVPCIGGKPDFVAWAGLWNTYLPWASHIWVEEVHAMPGQGVSSMFDFGRSYGFVIGLVASAGVPFSFVRPNVWKPAVGIPNGSAKGASRLRAKQLFPGVDYFDRAKDDGRADAALIGYYGANRNGDR